MLAADTAGAIVNTSSVSGLRGSRRAPDSRE